MDRLKSYFVIPWLLVMVFAIIHASIAVVFYEQVALAWYGILIGFVPMLGFFVWVMRADVSSTSRNLPIQVLASCVGMALAIYDPDVVATTYAVVCFIGVFGYIFWFGQLKRDPNTPLVVGEILPEFTLKTTSGESIGNSELVGSPSLLMFYRGNWCPLCVAQVREIAAQYRELAELGVNVIMVSPQPGDDTESLAERFDAPMTFAVDEGLELAKKWKLVHVGGATAGQQDDGALDTVFPTIVVTDASNKIVWMDETDNYRVRPEPEVFLSILREHAVVA